MIALCRPPRPAGALELSGDLVVVHWHKAVLLVSGAEIAGLLHHDRGVWARAIRRGRSWRRAEALARRETRQRQEATP